MFRRLSPVTEPNRESSGPNAAPLSQILQEPSPQSHPVPLSRILASQSPLGYAPVDASGGLHAAPLSQILASPSPLLDRPPAPPASPSFWLHHPPASPSSLQHRPPASLSPLLHRLPPSPSPLPHHLPASPSFLFHHPPAPPSPLLQPRRSTTLAPVRQNSRRSRTPPQCCKRAEILSENLVLTRIFFSRRVSTVLGTSRRCWIMLGRLDFSMYRSAPKTALGHRRWS
jgi:hypothetical protein